MVQKCFEESYLVHELGQEYRLEQIGIITNKIALVIGVKDHFNSSTKSLQKYTDFKHIFKILYLSKGFVI